MSTPYNVSRAMVLMNITNTPNTRGKIWPRHTQTYQMGIPAVGIGTSEFQKLPG